VVVKINFRYLLVVSDSKFWILDFGFWICGIASLDQLIKKAEYHKSKIRILKSKIKALFIIGT